MSNLFLFFSVLSFLGLIVGLIRPTLFKKTRKQLLFAFGGLTFVFFVMFSLVPASVEVPTLTQSVTEQTPPVVKQPTFAELAQKKVR